MTITSTEHFSLCVPTTTSEKTKVTCVHVNLNMKEIIAMKSMRSAM